MSTPDTASTGQDDLPASFQKIVDDFHALQPRDRLQLLLEFSDELPELPQKYQDHPDLLEPVPECQSPIFIIAEVEGSGPEAIARLFFSAPAEAPTTRGFAGILAEALDGRTAGDVMRLPIDAPLSLGLDGVVSPLRLRGMTGMLARIKRQVQDKAGL